MDDRQNKDIEEKIKLIIQLMEELFSDEKLDTKYQGNIDWIKTNFQFTNNLEEFQKLLTFLDDNDLIKTIYHSLKFKYDYIVENERVRQEIEEYKESERFLSKAKADTYENTNTVNCGACDQSPCICSDPQHNS